MDLQDILGRECIKEIHSHPHKFEFIEELDDAKYLFRVGGRQHEEILTYNKILDNTNCQNNLEEYNETFVCKTILDHRQAKNRKYKVLVQWSTGEETREPLRFMIKEDPVMLAAYAANKNLLDLDQWKHLRIFHCQLKYILKMITGAVNSPHCGIKWIYTGRKHGVHYKSGIQVPNYFHHALESDKQNKN